MAELAVRLRKKDSPDGGFAGAVVLITGGGSGIGQTCATEFVLAGCRKLFLVDLTLSKLEATRSLIEAETQEARVELYVGDVTDETIVKDMVQRCVDEFGRLDIACNNAGISGVSGRTDTASIEDYDQVIAVNQRGVFLCQKYEIAQMLQQDKGFGDQRGVIVNTASIAGHCIIPTASSYAASKHAVVAITRTDALKHAQDAIRVNAVSPGAVWTPMLSAGNLPDELLKLGPLMAPMHRYLQPIEVAGPILFLASPKASALTGVNIPVDCGTFLLRST